MNDRIRVHVCRTLEEVEEIRPIWTSFNCHPNSHIDFYLTVVNSMEEILRPHVLIVYRDGMPEAMLVGRLERKNMEFRVGYKNFGQSAARCLTFIYGGFIGNTSTDNAEASVRAIMKSLRDGEADVAFFNHLRIDTPLYNAATQFPGSFFRNHFQVAQTHRSMRLPGSKEQFEAVVSPIFHKRERQRNRALVRDHGGDVKVCHFSGTHELSRVIRDVDEIARKTYQRGLGAGFIANDEMRSRLQVEAKNGWLQTFILYVAGRPCAFWMCNLCAGQLHSSFMGYDPAFVPRYSPGMFLITRAMEELSDQNSHGRIEQIDWGFGDAEYKRRLSTEDWKEASPYIFAPTTKGFALNLLHSGGAAIDGAAKKALATAFVAKIKKSWRQRLRRSAAESY